MLILLSWGLRIQLASKNFSQCDVVVAKEVHTSHFDHAVVVETDFRR